MNQLKWILFDFGGCLDSDGVHSRTLFFEHFVKAGLLIQQDVSDHFQDAYTYSDRMVIDNSLILKSNLLEMNEVMCSFIADKLKLPKNQRSVVAKIAKTITETQSNYLKRNKKIIKLLRQKYHLGIISNFSGNLLIILEEFSLLPYFTFVLDSYYVGHSKPSPEIFKLAINQCKVNPEEICFVGDNILRDIRPAKELGLKTVLIDPIGQPNPADYSLTSLEELLLLTQRKYPATIQKISTKR